MAGAIRKTMMYLGLADDQGEDPDVYDDEYDEAGMDVPSDYQAPVTQLRRSGAARDVASIAPQPRAGDLARITTVHPRSYNDARVIGEAFRDGIPVIMNLSDMDDSDAKRLVDFSAGLIFGLNGGIERVTNKVFLLSPQNVEVTDEGQPPQAGHASRAGFYNQS